MHKSDNQRTTTKGSGMHSGLCATKKTSSQCEAVLGNKVSYRRSIELQARGACTRARGRIRTLHRTHDTVANTRGKQSMATRYLVPYDLSDPDRLKKVYGVVKTSAQHVQNSVYEALLTEKERVLFEATTQTRHQPERRSSDLHQPR
jgi:hypothetical protein